jgi:hypothetical protein
MLGVPSRRGLWCNGASARLLDKCVLHWAKGPSSLKEWRAQEQEVQESQARLRNGQLPCDEINLCGLGGAPGVE